MGVDCKTYVPQDVTLINIERIVGILAGLKPEMRSYGTFDAVAVPGVRFDGWRHCPAGDIVVEVDSDRDRNDAHLADGARGHQISFHPGVEFEGKFWSLLMARSTPFWCALGKRLVSFVGGLVVFNDCADDPPLRRKRTCPTEKRGHFPTDGKPYAKLQRAIMNLGPVTKEELAGARKVASYTP